MVTKNIRAISYEGNTLKTTMPITSRGKKSKNGRITIHSNLNGSNDVPSVRTSVAIDSKYVEGADLTRDYFVIGGVYSMPKKEQKPKAKVKAKGKAKTEEVVDLSQVKSAIELLRKAGVQLGS